MADLERPPAVLVNRCLIHNEEGELLLVRRAADDGNSPGLWEAAGGKLEAGQDMLEALRAEVTQETGLEIEVDSRLVYNESRVLGPDSKYPGATYLVLFWLGRVAGREVQVQLSNEHDDHVWVATRGALAYNLTHETRHAIRALDLNTSETASN